MPHGPPEPLPWVLEYGEFPGTGLQDFQQPGKKGYGGSAGMG